MIVFFMCFYITAVAESGNDSHGGDTVFCEKSEHSVLQGYFNLDYLLTFTAQNNNNDIAPVTSWEMSHQRISSILKKKMPALIASFTEFVKSQFNTDNYELSHFWEEGAFGLVLVDNSNDDYQYIDRSLPKNCYKKDDSKSIHLIRTITRTQKGPDTYYVYDKDLIDAQSAVQQSFLYIHEWLRSYTNDERLIREVNRLLHSQQVELPEFDLSHALGVIGFETNSSLHYGGFVSVNHRTPQIQHWLETHLGKEASAILPEDLNGMRVSDIILADQALPSLMPGDFGSLKISSLDLSYNQLKQIPPGVFHRLSLESWKVGSIFKKDYQKIDLSFNQIDSIAPFTFYMVKAQEIDLSHNQIRNISATAFSEIQLPILVDLSNNRLTGLTEETFKNVSRLALNLSNNDFTEIPLKALANVRMVHELNLSGNRIRLEPEPIAIHNQSVIKNLNLDRTQINDIGSKLNDILKSRQVRSISLKENQIENIPAGAFSGLDHIVEEINLSKNEITTIHSQAFQKLKIDQTIRNRIVLSENRLRTLPEELIDLLIENPRLYLFVENNLFPTQYQQYLKTRLRDQVIL